jgi:tetratricopeptide (TPR) repeat protein
VIGKYIDATPDSEARAEAAFRRALEIDPRLTIAHKFYAALEADIGQAPRAIARLLREAGRHGNDAELFAGLVHACRYGGLLDASLAADAEARRLDPGIDTSVEETLLVAGELDRLLARDRPALVTGTEDANRVIALVLAGRRDEARPVLDEMRSVAADPLSLGWIDYLAVWIDRRPANMVFDPSLLTSLKIQDDPEAIFQEAWMLCEAGEFDRGLARLRRAVSAGYYAFTALSSSRHFDAVRQDPAFQWALAEAEAGRRRALEALRAERGERLLGATAGRG